MHYEWLRRLVIFILAILFIGMLTSCTSQKRKDPPKAIEGVLDLTNWDFNRNGAVELDGQWAYYPGQLLEPDDFTAGNSAVNAGTMQYAVMKVPDNSETYDGINRKIFKTKGVGTYRLKVVTSSQELLTLNTFSVEFGAHKLWVNDKWMDTNGNLNDPHFLGSFSGQKLFPLRLEKNTFTITLQSSNITRSLILNTSQNFNASFDYDSNVEIALSSIILIIALYHFALYLFRRKDKSSLYFAAFCLFIIVVQITSLYEKNICDKGLNNISSWMISQFGVVVNILIWDESIDLSSLFFLLFIIEIFSTTYKRGLFIFQVILLLFNAICTLSLLYFLSIHDLNSCNTLFAIINFSIVIFALITIYYIICATYQKQENAIILLVGTLLIFISAFLDHMGCRKLSGKNYF